MRALGAEFRVTPTYRKRPRKNFPPPLAGGGARSDVQSDCGGGAAARELRANMTDAERKLWNVLRRKHINGLRFRRQYQLGSVFCGFYLLACALDRRSGWRLSTADEEQVAHDLRRTAWLNGQNFRVLRFWNLDVLKNLDGVIDVIDAAVREPLPRTSLRVRAPSRKGRGESSMSNRHRRRWNRRVGQGDAGEEARAAFRFAHLDSGSLYRLVALGVVDAKGDPNEEAMR